MSASAYRSAWADPEHMRLASYRSPDDGNTVALRGGLPPFLDPWVGQSAAPAGRAPQDGKRGYPRHDDYAAHRCRCQHIVYRDDVPGGSCRFCPCTDHRPPGGSS